MTIYSNDYRLSYCGRIDWTNERAPVMVFPASSVAVRFFIAAKTITSVRVRLKNRNVYWDNYMGSLSDGKQSCHRLVRDGEAVLDIGVAPNKSGEHIVTLFKRQDGCHEVTLLSIELPDGAKLLPPLPVPNRRIEVFGDSVAAGEVCEALEYEGVEDPVHYGQWSNSYFAFPWVTARKLRAQVHDIAQGGIALQDGNGWYGETDELGMLSVWDKVHYSAKLKASSTWDFSQWQADVVIVAIGQNDSHPRDFMAEDYDGGTAKKWLEDYALLLSKIRAVYPAALIVCCTTLLNHSPLWDKAICEAVASMRDKAIVQMLFRRNGCGTGGHPRITEQEEMAGELAAFIAKRMGWQY